MGQVTVPLPSSRAMLRLEDGGLRERRYQLSVTQGPDAGKTVPLTGTLVVGSHPQAGLPLTDTTVSRYHVELEARPDGVRVRDLQSTNGTLLAGARVGEVIVERECTVQIGKTALRVSFVEHDVDSGDGAPQLGQVLGHSPAMRRLLGVLEKVATSDATVVLEGETGTGKELLAEAIHQASPRRERPLVVVDCGALAKELIESELFGHVKGSFTGAVADRDGALLQADGGTVFLDEIGELPLDVQPKLLRVLESGTVKRVGENEARRIDVRVVAATHRDLKDRVARGEFRQDLYYRLAVVPVRVPPLRERREDIPLLVKHFLQRAGNPDFDLSPELVDRLQSYAWPGNVRELRNVVERALSSGGDDLLPDTPPTPGRAALSELPFKEAKERMVDAFTREYLQSLLDRCGGNVSQMARSAGIARHYLRKLVDRYGLRSKPDPKPT